MIELFDHQLKALDQIHNGCILCGGVGSGKSITALAYYYRQNGGVIPAKSYTRMKDPKDLYIITTARKRDTREWLIDMAPFLLTDIEEDKVYEHKVVIDSWNNIKKYVNVKDAFFIFDEQRVVGYGTWTKSFLEITAKNEWILLSATPGDCWSDYMPVFIANGFYRNKTDFVDQHVIYDRFSKYPKISRYLNTGRLLRLKARVMVYMDFERETIPHHETVWCQYNQILYKDLITNRFNLETNKPFLNANELCIALRKVVNSDPSRIQQVFDIVSKCKKAIVFYNYDYELDILRAIGDELSKTLDGFEYAEWNGHLHQDIPQTSSWMYLVQYNAGSEGWNCTKTDTIIFYSQNYSYKMMTQAAGRIDRLNTPYRDLYYYHLKSRASIDLAISRALAQKKQFNEQRFVLKTERTAV